MKSFVSTDSVTHKGKTDVWLTPLKLLKRIGEFDLDPCGYPGHNTAKNMFCLPQDGLNLPWDGKVWLNPPYSECEKWLDKLEKHQWGVALVFVRTGTRYMQRFLESATHVCFIKGRISFERPDGSPSHNAGCDSMLLCYNTTVKDKTLGVIR